MRETVKVDDKKAEEQQKDRAARTKQIMDDLAYYKREVTGCLTATNYGKPYFNVKEMEKVATELDELTINFC